MKIAVTKLKEKSEGIPELFRRYGHEAVIVSTMSASDPTDPAPLIRLAKMASKGEIDILIFTSALGVGKLFERAKPAKTVRIVSVGPKTAKKVEEHGFSSEVIAQFSSEHFAEYLGDIRGKTIGIARAEVPNPELVESLASRGATIIEAPAYRLEPAGKDIADVLKDADAVIFTSAKSFESAGFNHDQARTFKVIAIGEKTAEAMRKLGVIPDIIGSGTLESCLEMLS
ncbi:MAG: uroporphyrinogen-III synthase [Candidatus Methanoperedens sp.]|nr:uroporphyrinogen-III synthase [Candidatus Methanoperedens sp.]